MALDPDIKAQLAKQGRLWAVSVVCAFVGAFTIYKTGQLATGVLAFLVSLLVLGGALFIYERRHR